MQPLGDLSYLDLLPQRGENNNNFTTFVTDKDILINFSGRYLIFDLKGSFQGQVAFTGVSEGFRSQQIKLVNVSDSGKFYVFQGPRFLTKEQREAKRKARKEAKAAKKANKDKGDKKDKKEKKDIDLASLSPFEYKKIKEKAEKELQKQKKKLEKTQSGGKKAPIFYIFKLDQQEKITGKVEWRFTPYNTNLFPFVEEKIMASLTQSINH